MKVIVVTLLGVVVILALAWLYHWARNYGWGE